MLPSSIKPTNLASFMLVATGGCTSGVLVSVVSVMPGLEMTSCSYSLATHSFLSFTICRSYVFSGCSLEWPKAEPSEALRASEVSL